MLDMRFSAMAGRLRRTEIRELLKLTRMPGTISFCGGLPDPAIFPYEAVRAASERVINERGDLALQYSPTEGEPFLREQAALYLARQGEPAEPEDIIAVASSQQALDLLSKIFIDPGDSVIVERPCYVGAIQAFRAFGADFQGVEMDENGMIPDDLGRVVSDLVGRGRKPKFVYVIPDFQNPSGINLTLDRRKRVLEIASDYDLVIIEDSPYRELRYSGELIPSLRSLDCGGRVVQMKTFSKVFSPGLRVGWIVAPPAIREKLVMAKQGTDLCTSAYTSILSAYLLRDGAVEDQIEVSKKIYARKVKVMCSALERHMPTIDSLTWSKPEGGMFLWLKLPEYMDTADMIQDAVRLKVAYVIGSAFYYDGSGRNAMRLNYSYPTEEQIEQGVERLSRLVKMRIRETCEIHR
jgi:2-aminoadipate transaminase